MGGPHPDPLPEAGGDQWALTLALSQKEGSMGPHPGPLPEGEGINVYRLESCACPTSSVLRESPHVQLSYRL